MNTDAGKPFAVRWHNAEYATIETDGEVVAELTLRPGEAPSALLRKGTAGERRERIFAALTRAIEARGGPYTERRHEPHHWQAAGQG
jgi:hypothetical protein